MEERTRSWITKLIPLLDVGNVFIIVGAAHLVGPYGLIQLLKKKGYNVTKILNEL